jgi:hypothetical protein
MNLPVDPATVSGSNVQVECVNSTYSGAIDVSLQEGAYCGESKLVVTFTPALPDQDCCTITLDGMTSVYGQSSVAQFDVTPLAGDVDRDGQVLTTDASRVKARFQEPVGPETFIYDVDCDGQIITPDASAVKSRFQHTAPDCP